MSREEFVALCREVVAYVDECSATITSDNQRTTTPPQKVLPTGVVARNPTA